MRRPALLLLLLPLALPGCGGDSPAPPPATTVLDQATPPLRYDYLTKLRLNVASISIQDRSSPGPNDVSNLSPVPPAQALQQMAQDRLAAGGSTGQAVFIIQNASIQRTGDTLAGTLAVRLEITTNGSTPTAYAEARVTRSLANFDGPLRNALYTMTRQMMDDMNVEFEYQVRHSLKDWLQDTTPVAAPAPVQAQPLDQSAPPTLGGPPPAAAPGSVTR